MAGSSVAASTAAYVLLVLASLCNQLALPAGAVLFDYPTMSTQNHKDIRIEGDASLSDGWIDVSANRYTGISGSTGRATYAPPVPLWDGATGEAASFTTRFALAIVPPGASTTTGIGMTFFLAGYPSSMPGGSGGFNLGLTNQSADAVASGDGRFVALEFDTFYDPEVAVSNSTYDHIGINVNSLRSRETTPIPNFRLTGNMTAEIRYDNVSAILAMTLWLGDGRGQSYSVSSKVDLRSVLPEKVTVGFSAATSTSIELHQVRSWYFNSSLEMKGAPHPTPSADGIVVGVTVGVASLILVCLAAVLVIRRRNYKMKKVEEDNVGSEDDHDDEPTMEIEMGTGPRRFAYHELLIATSNFAVEGKLGQGGFGAVYQGHLTDLGLAVAVKRFSKESSMQGRKEYKSEIKVISRLRHRNLVQLIGWCHGRHELLIVYKLMPNRSLDIHLYSTDTLLTWPRRVKILLGLAAALLYLQEEWEQCVVHRDVKPSNIMLDESFNARLGDFGLARLIDHTVGMQTMTAVSGTPGYVDPQYVITGLASAESDVYSFGVVLLEIACGKRPMTLRDGGVFRLVDWVWDLYGQGAVLAAADERLNGDYDAAEMERVMVVGLWCAHPDPSARPPIRAAMAVLQSKDASHLPVLPAKMPVPTFAAPVGLRSLGSLSTGMSASSATQSWTTSGSGYGAHTSSSSDAGISPSSSLLKHLH